MARFGNDFVLPLMLQPFSFVDIHIKYQQQHQYHLKKALMQQYFLILLSETIFNNKTCTTLCCRYELVHAQYVKTKKNNTRKTKHYTKQHIFTNIDQFIEHKQRNLEVARERYIEHTYVGLIFCCNIH